MGGRRMAGMVALAAALGLAGAAQAEPGLANRVYSPYVKNGVDELELRAGRLNGGPLAGEASAVVELERGVSDRLSLAMLGEFERHAGEETKLDSVGLEAVAYLGQIPGIGVDVGGYLEYEQRIHNESGVVEGKLLLAKRAGPAEVLVNLIAEKALTDRPGEDATAFGYAAQATLEAGRGLRLGGQAFGDLGTRRAFAGRQSHYLGPMANWELHPAWMKGGELELEAAYLFPAGAERGEAASQLRLMLEFERRF
jgi:hypothetical protein